MIKVKTISARSYISPTKLPSADYVINPYVGCPHKCAYCYAEFMKRFSDHQEPWGDFLDVKICSKKINVKKYENSTFVLSSVTDAYNPYEKKFEITREILKQFEGSSARIGILTKSDLVLRDLDIIKNIKNISVTFSLNTLDDKFRKDVEPYASSVQKRINALKVLKENKISTALFMAPMFPGITDFKAIIDETKNFADEFWFENLNLRTLYKTRILAYISKNYSHLIKLYHSIYNFKKIDYWNELETQIAQFCKKENINCRIYFHHEKIRKP